MQCVIDLQTLVHRWIHPHFLSFLEKCLKDTFCHVEIYLNISVL